MQRVVSLALVSLALGSALFACSSTPRAELPADGTGTGTGDEDGGTGTDPEHGGEPGACSVTSKGSAGVVLQGRVLAPEGPIDGEVLVDANGTIT